MKALITPLISIMAVSSASAAISLTLSGTTGSTTINYVASGSYEVGTNTSSTSISRFALADGSWFTEPGEDVGNFFTSGIGGSQSDVALSVPIQFSITGSTTYNRDLTKIELLKDNSTGTAPDTVRLEFASIDTVPSVSAGDIISLSGSGTFDLTGSTDFDDLIQGTYTGGAFGDQFEFVIAQVPEPSMTTLVAAIGMMALATRRRRN